MTTINLAIQFKDTGKNSRYFAGVEGERVLLIFSHEDENVIAANHTYVPREIEGRRLAHALAAFAVEDARAKGWNIRPAYSYVVVKFKEHPEWADVLAS